MRLFRDSIRNKYIQVINLINELYLISFIEVTGSKDIQITVIQEIDRVSGFPRRITMKP